MIKKMKFPVVVFLIGIGIAIWMNVWFRELIQTLYLVSTHNRLRFHGEYSHFSPSLYYTLAFGLFGTLFYLARRNIKYGLVEVIVFSLSLVLLSSFAMSTAT